MVTIPKEFFREECRDGFYISEVMKKSWAVQLTLLDEILEIADRHNIRIWLDCGSLLGAVRHHGYIPWDDDVDTAVMRKDYVPLINYLKEELPPYRVVSSFYTNPAHDKPTAVISSRANMDIDNDPYETKLTQLHYGFRCSSWIDIFPLDYVPSDPERWEMIRNLYFAANEMASDIETCKASPDFEPTLQQLEKLTKTKIKRDENLAHSLWMLSEKLASMTTRKEARYIGWYGGALHTGSKCIRPLSAYSGTIMADFEIMKAPIPTGYDSILTMLYESEYMTPVRASAGHDYPHFKNQEMRILACNKTGQLGDIF